MGDLGILDKKKPILIPKPISVFPSNQDAKMPMLMIKFYKLMRLIFNQWKVFLSSMIYRFFH